MASALPSWADPAETDAHSLSVASGSSGLWSLFVAVALGISVTASYFIALDRLDRRIDDELTQEV